PAGPNTLSSGTAGAPAVSFSGDSDTGIYSPGAGKIALVENGVLFLHSIGNNNTALGTSALSNDTTGSNNTAVGNASLTSNTIGFNNTAAGNSALANNTTGQGNTAAGE